ncbi:MAG: hypothetical protein M3347_10395, partial [Armatimonadota bacterium]|nr:hypothetical protein [Armatimonadota bacterium]
MQTTAFVILAVCLAVNLSSSAPAKRPIIKVKPQTHCHVHGERLKHEWVKVKYGLRYLGKDYVEARQKLFPFSHKTWGGGCVITKHSPKFKKVDYCKKCRSAEWNWKQGHASK